MIKSDVVVWKQKGIEFQKNLLFSYISKFGGRIRYKIEMKNIYFNVEI